MDTFEIKNIAEAALKALGRCSLSDHGFSNEQIDCISQAIADAIEAYDQQQKNQ